MSGLAWSFHQSWLRSLTLGWLSMAREFRSVGAGKGLRPKPAAGKRGGPLGRGPAWRWRPAGPAAERAGQTRRDPGACGSGAAGDPPKVLHDQEQVVWVGGAR